MSQSPLRSFFAELRRRRVVRVAVAYAAVGWVLIEVASTVAPELLLPAWVPRVVIFLVLLGFPLALVLAWAFDLTPTGMRRTGPVPPADAGTRAAEAGTRVTDADTRVADAEGTGAEAAATGRGPEARGSPAGPADSGVADSGATDSQAATETLPSEASGPSPTRLWAAAGLALAILLVVAIGVFVVPGRLARAEAERARTLLPEIERLADEGRYAVAYSLAEEAEAALDDDSVLAALWPRISDRLTVLTDPDSAAVRAIPFARGGEPAEGGPEEAPEKGAAVADWTSVPVLGRTPIREFRIPRTDHLLRIEREGWAPVERLASSALIRTDAAYDATGGIVLEVELVPAEEAPEGMVAVPGGAYELVTPDLPVGLSAPLDDYFIDRFEVTNEAFREFVAGGGYATRGLWPSPLVSGGDTLAFEEAMEVLVDRTGLRGPRGWTGQDPPEGRGRHPVTGVTWYEASAYCAFREKRLATVFQWEKAARDGRIAHVGGTIMPWGLMTPGSSARERANFGGAGTVPVERHPFGISPYGAYAMAGNAKEWTANPAGDGGRVITGGSWEDPHYLFSEIGVFEPAHASSSLGFRCARVRADDARRRRDQGSFALEMDQRTPEYEPVDEATFRSLLSHYRYDPRPLEPEILETVETEDWIREKVSYTGPEGGRVLAYLWLPKSTPAPHQTLVHVPGAEVFFAYPVSEHVEHFMVPHIRAGRALFSVVMKGMVERSFGPGWEPPEPSSVRFRDLMVRHATELRLGLDYLESRDDIDTGALAYTAISFGAGSRLLFAAVDDRFDAVVFIGGGIDERIKPTLPAADNVNFAPYIDAPKLLVNGRHDEEHPWLTRALPLWNLLREPKELVLVEGAGHVPPPEERVPAIEDFLDRTLGPAAERGGPR